jgi:hypothetical protein
LGSADLKFDALTDVDGDIAPDESAAFDSTVELPLWDYSILFLLLGLLGLGLSFSLPFLMAYTV